MSILGLEFFGYNPNIVREEKSIPGMDIEICCHSNIWTTKRKVAAFAVAAIALLTCLTATALYYFGIINFPTLLACLSTGGTVFLLDAALIINYVKKHNLFVKDVGEYLKNHGNFDFRFPANAMEPGHVSNELPIYRDNPSIKGCLVIKTSEKTVIVHYFESERDTQKMLSQLTQS